MAGPVASPQRSQHPAVAAAPERRPRLFHGWWIVLCSWLGDFFSVGISSYAFGLFFKPMSQELGWNRGMVSFALALRSLVNIALGPVVGRVLDRFGPRLLMAGGRWWPAAACWPSAGYKACSSSTSFSGCCGRWALAP